MPRLCRQTYSSLVARGLKSIVIIIIIIIKEREKEYEIIFDDEK